jgi:hypothetical protein
VGSCFTSGARRSCLPASCRGGTAIDPTDSRSFARRYERELDEPDRSPRLPRLGELALRQRVAFLTATKYVNIKVARNAQAADAVIKDISIVCVLQEEKGADVLDPPCASSAGCRLRSTTRKSLAHMRRAWRKVRALITCPVPQRIPGTTETLTARRPNGMQWVWTRVDIAFPGRDYWRSIFSKITRATSLATFFLRKSTI